MGGLIKLSLNKFVKPKSMTKALATVFTELTPFFMQAFTGFYEGFLCEGFVRGFMRDFRLCCGV